MRMRLGLSGKITFAAALPLAAYLYVAWSQVSEGLKENEIAGAMATNVELVVAASALIHETQMERGFSVGFLSGTIPSEKVMEERRSVDSKVESFLLNLKAAPIDATVKTSAISALESLKDIRRRIDSKAVTPLQAMGAYTTVLRSFLDTQFETTKVQDVQDIRPKIRALYVLERAKENAGQLRARMTRLMSANTPISEEEVETLIDLRSGIDANLNSPAIVLAPEIKEQIVAFGESSNWTSIQAKYRRVLMNASQGRYDLDPREYFAEMTSAIDAMSGFVTAETRVIADDIASAKAEIQASLMKTIAAAVGILLSLALILWRTIRSISRPIDHAVTELNKASAEVSGASRQLQMASQQISSAGVEAAASVEETVAALNQMVSELTAVVKGGDEENLIGAEQRAPARVASVDRTEYDAANNVNAA